MVLKPLWTALARRYLVGGAPDAPGPVPHRIAPVEITVSDAADDQALKIMVAEINDLAKGMREFLLTADRFVYLGGLIAAAALTLGMIRRDTGQNWLVLVFAPYALALVLGYLVQIYTEVEKRAGYKRFLEDRVNSMVGSPVLLESKVNSWKARTRPSIYGMQLLNGCALAGLAYQSWQATRVHLDQGRFTWHHVNTIGLALTVLIVVAAVVENTQAHRRAHQAAADAAHSFPHGNG